MFKISLSCKKTTVSKVINIKIESKKQFLFGGLHIIKKFPWYKYAKQDFTWFWYLFNLHISNAIWLCGNHLVRKQQSVLMS